MFDAFTGMSGACVEMFNAFTGMSGACVEMFNAWIENRSAQPRMSATHGCTPDGREVSVHSPLPFPVSATILVAILAGGMPALPRGSFVGYAVRTILAGGMPALPRGSFVGYAVRTIKPLERYAQRTLVCFDMS
jgi:hypothetical protein